jgi:hypothetical protein
LVNKNRWIIKNGIATFVLFHTSQARKTSNFAIMAFINSIKALIFYLLIVIFAWFGLLFAMTPAVPFIFLNRRIYFRWCSFIMGYFLLMITVNIYFFFLKKNKKNNFIF